MPVFGETRLNELSGEQVARWVADMRRRGLAASTIRTYKSQLSGILTLAVDLGYIA